MRNLLLLTITSISLLFSVSSWAIENQFYLKAEVGTSKMNNVKLNDKKLKHNMAGIVGGGGAGYYILDNVRADLMLNFFANQQSKYFFAGTDSKIKSQITTLVLSGYVDVFDISICEFFIGLGAGVGQLKNEIIGNNKLGASTYTNKKNNLVYHLTLGVAAKLAPVVKVEIAYSWKDFGSTKENYIKSLPYKGHNVTLGIRFDI